MYASAYLEKSKVKKLKYDIKNKKKEILTKKQILNKIIFL